MKRIMVIGSGGAGKSTFSRRLGEMLQIEVFHLDSLFWKPGWVESDKKAWAEVQKELVKKESWIIDGNYGGTMDIRLEAADTIIYLDMPRLISMYRVFKRFFMYRKKSRPDMTDGCIEQLDPQFLQWVWTFNGEKRIHLLHKLETLEDHKQIIILRSPREVNVWLDKLVV